MVKNLPAKAGDARSIPGLGRPPGEGNGNPLQYSCLGNPMDRGAWWATVHGVKKESDTTERLNNNWTQLSLHSCGLGQMQVEAFRAPFDQVCLSVHFCLRRRQSMPRILSPSWESRHRPRPQRWKTPQRKKTPRPQWQA